MATERDEFEFPAVGAAIHGAAESWVATVNRFVDIFHLSISGMERIFNFFIMVCKNSLYALYEFVTVWKFSYFEIK